MIGLNVLFGGSIAGVLDIGVIDLLDDIELDGGVDYAPTHTYNVYDDIDQGVVSSCSQGKLATLYGHDYTNYGDFYRLVTADNGQITNINRMQSIFKQESAADLLCSCDSGKLSTLYGYIT